MERVYIVIFSSVITSGGFKKTINLISSYKNVKLSPNSYAIVSDKESKDVFDEFGKNVNGDEDLWIIETAGVYKAWNGDLNKQADFIKLFASRDT